MLSLSSKSRIFLYNAHLALFVRMDDTITRTNAIGTYCHSKLELALEGRALFADQQQADSLQTGKECECKELRFRRGSPLACGVMGIAWSSYNSHLETFKD